MKAKIIKDGERIIITFTEIENSEEFLQKVVNIVSSSAEEEIVPQEVLGLTPPVENEEHEESYTEEEREDKEMERVGKEEEIEDFDAPFTGKTPKEIISAPRFEGFYFLCRARIPARYKEECNRLLYEFAEKRKIHLPPYGEKERMKNYLVMAQKILGDENLPGITDTIQAIDADPHAIDALDVLCEKAAERISIFFSSKKP